MLSSTRIGTSVSEASRQANFLISSTAIDDRVHFKGDYDLLVREVAWVISESCALSLYNILDLCERSAHRSRLLEFGDLETIFFCFLGRFECRIEPLFKAIHEPVRTLQIRHQSRSTVNKIRHRLSSA